MVATDKDTIYIDIDDEITGIIDKVTASKGKIVALVLPKRATTLQSIVNMKLLKRAADDSKKHLVLITTEAGLMPLAGAAGVHVAKTLNSKPEVPLGPDSVDHGEEETIDETGEDEEVTAEADGDRPVGELAGGAAVAAAGKDDMETLELDDDVLPEAEAPEVKSKSFEPPKGKKDKKLSVPNFERFRKLLIIGGAALVLLLVGFLYLTFSAPKATITIKTDATNIDTEINANLSTAAKEVDTDNHTLPAVIVSEQKSYTQQVATTGQKNNGNKASGSITMSAQECGVAQQADDVPAGTGVTANGQTYITQSNTSFSPKSIKNGCINFEADNATQIIAQTGGTSFNTTGSVTFSVAGRKDVTAKTNAGITGGTDSIVQTVNQGDINTAKDKINTNDSSVKTALETQLKQKGLYPIDETFSPGTPTTTTSANVGEVANTVTVTENITYTMFGVKRDDLDALVNDSVDNQIDPDKQKVLSDGIDTATYTVNGQTATTAQVAIKTTVVAGPELDINQVKEMAKGKKPGEIKSELGTNPDVTGVDVKLSPFWVGNLPKKTDRITVIIAKPTTKANAANANNP
jgi:hypothetical protein